MTSFIKNTKLFKIPLPATVIEPFEQMDLGFKFSTLNVEISNHSGLENWQSPAPDLPITNCSSQPNVFGIIDDLKLEFKDCFKPIKTTMLKDYKDSIGQVVIPDLVLSKNDDGNSGELSGNRDSLLNENGKREMVQGLKSSSKSLKQSSSNTSTPQQATKSPSVIIKNIVDRNPKTSLDWQKLQKYYKSKRDDEKIRKKPEWISFYNCAINICLFSELSLLENSREYTEKFGVVEQKVGEFAKQCKKLKFNELGAIMY